MIWNVSSNSTLFLVLVNHKKDPSSVDLYRISFLHGILCAEFKDKNNTTWNMFSTRNVFYRYHKNILLQNCFCFCNILMFWVKIWIYFNDTLLTTPRLFSPLDMYFSNWIPFIGYFGLFENNCLDLQKNLLTWENARIFSF